MKNLVKILATLGLIVAIALILKGVFGIGKIGVNKISKKNTIRFDKCYDIDEFKNHKEHFNDGPFDDWYFDVELSENKATRTVVWKDEHIKKNKEKNDFIIPKVEMETFKIVSKSKDFAKTEKTSSNNKVNDYYIFFLKSGKMQYFTSLGEFRQTSNFQCKLY